MYSVFSPTYKFSERVKAALDSKRVGIFCLLLAILNKVTIAWLYTDLEDDKSLYLLLSESALKGKFFLEPVNFYNSAATEYIFNPATVSPLYSLLAVPLLWMTKSFVATSIIIDIISWSVFLTGLYTTALLLFKQRWIANAFILCTGFFLYPHELASTPKDTLAVGLMLWGCLFTYKVIRSHSYQLGPVCLASAAFFLLALTKFLYAPLALLFILILYVHARMSKRKEQFYYVRVAVLILFTSVLFFAIFIFYQKSHSSPLKINPDGTLFTRGFFPENLLKTFPFLISSLINTNFWGVQLERLFPISFADVIKGFQIIDLFLSGLVLWLVLRHYKEVKKAPVLFVLLGLVAAAIVFMVFTMSLTHKSVIYRSSGSSYTYVQEARSFLLVMLVIQLLVFYAVFKTSLPTSIKTALIVLLVLESFHGIYFTIKQFSGRREVIAQKQVSSPNKRIVSQIAMMIKEHPQVVIATPENTLRRLAHINGFRSVNLPDTCRMPFECKGPTMVAVLQSDSLTKKTCMINRPPSFSDTIPPFVLSFYNIQ